MTGNDFNAVLMVLAALIIGYIVFVLVLRRKVGAGPRRDAVEGVVGYSAVVALTAWRAVMTHDWTMRSLISVAGLLFACWLLRDLQYLRRHSDSEHNIDPVAK